MTITALMIFVLISQVVLMGYLLYSFNDVEREARKRNADLRAHVDRVVAELESRLRDATLREALRDEAEVTRKRATG
jgi:hypothetical protein